MYDLAAIYTVLIDGMNNIPYDLCKAISNILDNGYTYEDIRKEIIHAFNTHEMFPFYKFKTIKQNGNLLKQGIRYYHKQLNIMSQLNPVHYDIDSGTITSQEDEYWIEPRASYTAEDLMNYIYSKGIIDTKEYPPKRFVKLLGSLVSQYGLEIVLFMIEHCIRIYDSEHEMFSLKKFDTYHSIATGYLEEIKNNCVYSGSVDYVPRKRMLLN